MHAGLSYSHLFGFAAPAPLPGASRAIKAPEPYVADPAATQLVPVVPVIDAHNEAVGLRPPGSDAARIAWGWVFHAAATPLQRALKVLERAVPLRR